VLAVPAGVNNICVRALAGAIIVDIGSGARSPVRERA
jgi:hypothetical protein